MQCGDTSNTTIIFEKHSAKYDGKISLHATEGVLDGRNKCSGIQIILIFIITAVAQPQELIRKPIYVWLKGCHSQFDIVAFGYRFPDSNTLHSGQYILTCQSPKIMSMRMA